MAKIIVEICQNHNGDRALVKELIHAAKENGADMVKGQIIFSEDLTHRPRFDKGHLETNGVRKAVHRPYDAEYARLQTLDLANDDYQFFVEEALRVGITPMLTVFSRKRVPLAASLPWGRERFVKVASYDCGSAPLIRELAESFDHLIISTGATFNDEIEISNTIIAEAERQVPNRNLEHAHLYVFEPEFENGLPHLFMTDGEPPNGAELLGCGDAFPTTANDGDWFLRIDYEPSVLYKKEGPAWIRKEVDWKRKMTTANFVLERFINNRNKVATSQGPIDSKVGISKVVAPKVRKPKPDL